MVTIRAKFRCLAETSRRYSLTAAPVKTIEFQAIYDDTVPEDQRYAKATPSGSLTLVVDNPDVDFQPGRAYYLDITPAD